MHIFAMSTNGKDELFIRGKQIVKQLKKTKYTEDKAMASSVSKRQSHTS